MASVEKYIIPRAQVDVEAMAQQIFLYLRVHGEDTEFLSYDPALRDAKVAELYANPSCKASFWPDDIIGEDPSPEQVDVYLSQANAAIEALTPPKSIEDRVMRSHLASTALIMYQMYKCSYGLRDHYDLRSQLGERVTVLNQAWIRNEYPRLFPDRAAKLCGIQATSTPPPHQTPLIPPPTQHAAKPKAITTPDIEEYLNSPHTLLGKHFKHWPPSSEHQDYKGGWTLDSYTVRVREGVVDHEYQVLLEACEGATIPMDRADVEFLLRYSTIEP
ncbi:hypothetical protein GY45DRAFT_1439641 [Cubamyces sp. BRFM 1775]|nr:hypothetical protein GY45DRAFT_1439641 [Cubamyces sp. BRFM 1775]